MLLAELAVVSSTEVRLLLTLHAYTTRRDPVSGACAVTLGDADGDAGLEAGAASIRAFREVYSHLLNGEQLGASTGGAEICGRVVAHRRHSAALLFMDLQAGDETLQAVLRANPANAAFALATRRGNTSRVHRITSSATAPRGSRAFVAQSKRTSLSIAGLSRTAK